jgi:uncharacterized protein involved in response to NO
MTGRFTLFTYGFRPFFLLAGLFAVVAAGLWLYTLTDGTWPSVAPPAPVWHAHEMLFGLIGAAIAGFLLTAVPSWTGQPGYSGWPLAGLVGLWLAGRLAFFLYGLAPPPLVAAIDLAFFPLLGAMLAPAMIRGGKSKNLVFLLFLASLFIANLLIHLSLAQSNITLTATGLILAVNTILLMIAIIGGRIVPAFTSNALRQNDPSFTITPNELLDRTAILSVALILFVDLFWMHTTAAGILALAAGALHALRLARWKGLHTLREPIVWVLHLGYGWLVIGLLLKGVFILTGIAWSAGWLHALTIGAMATMILAVMSRAALGHTGRPIVAARPTTCAYVLLGLAALVRTTGPALPGNAMYWSTLLAGLLWLATFALFLIVYAPILVRPRADGKPG